MAARDYRERRRAARALQSGPGTVEMLWNAVGVVLVAPSVVVAMALTGLLSGVTPLVLGPLVVELGRAVGVTLAAPAGRVVYGGGPTTLPFPLRFVAVPVAVVLGAIPVAVGLLALLAPGVYAAVRLLLALPAVMLDGHGPVDALGKSWALMDGSVSATFAALVVVLAAGLAVGAPVLLVTRSEVLASVVVAIVAGVPSVGIQTYLYVELTGGT